MSELGPSCIVRSALLIISDVNNNIERHTPATRRTFVPPIDVE